MSCNRTIHLWELLTWSYPITHHGIHLWWQTSPIELGLFWVHEPAHVFGLWVVWRQGSEAYISLVYGIYINSCELCREVGNRASVSSAGWPTQFHNRDNLHQDLLPLPQRTLSFCQPVLDQCFFWCYVLLVLDLNFYESAWWRNVEVE